jgi:hypothetical protein
MQVTFHGNRYLCIFFVAINILPFVFFPLRVISLYIFSSCRITGISRYVGCPTIPNNRLDPTSVLFVQHHVHFRSILRERRTTMNNL